MEARLRLEDLAHLAAVTSARFDDPALEARRRVILRELNRAGQVASRRFAEFSRRGVSESWGSHSTWDLADEARSFFAAVAEYCAAIERSAVALGELAERHAAMAKETPHKRASGTRAPRPPRGS